MPAVFADHEVKSGLMQKKLLSGFLDSLVKEYRKDTRKVNLRYIFCSDDHLLQMNQQFLQHDTYTDIITFDLTERTDHLVGEMYISIDRVRDNAARFKVSEADELLRVICHGALHLCGFKDKKPKDVAIMRTMEELCIAKYKKQIA